MTDDEDDKHVGGEPGAADELVRTGSTDIAEHVGPERDRQACLLEDTRRETTSPGTLPVGETGNCGSKFLSPTRKRQKTEHSTTSTGLLPPHPELGEVTSLPKKRRQDDGNG